MRTAPRWRDDGSRQYRRAPPAPPLLAGARTVPCGAGFGSSFKTDGSRVPEGDYMRYLIAWLLGVPGIVILIWMLMSGGS
jgi:hypothetical protein